MITPEVFKEKLDQFGEGIFQGCLAIIDSYNKSKGTAKVIPLLKAKRESDTLKYPVLSNVPIIDYSAGNIRVVHDYKKGDLVWLLFSTFEISNAIKGQHELINDKFAFENCVILGGLSKQPSVLNSLMQKDGLVITDNESMSAQFASSKIELKAGSDSAQKMLLGEDTVDLLKDLVDAILEITVMTPVGPSSPVTAITTNATKLNLIKIKLQNLLSSGVKNN